MTAVYNAETSDQIGTPFTPGGNFEIAVTDDNGYWQGCRVVVRKSLDGGATFPFVAHVFKSNDNKVIEASATSQARVDIENINSNNAISVDWIAL